MILTVVVNSQSVALCNDSHDCNFFFFSFVTDRRKALSREMEKELIIPLPHPVRPEDGECLTVICDSQESHG